MRSGPHSWKRRKGRHSVKRSAPDNQEHDRRHAVVAVTTRAGPKGTFEVDLPLDAATLNERLFEVGLWLIERHVPHQARIVWEPYHRRIRVSFPDADDAGAFRVRFGAPLH